MKRDAVALMQAMRADALETGNDGLWKIRRVHFGDLPVNKVTNEVRKKGYPFQSMTMLLRVTLATMHLENSGECVMEDSPNELRKHLPILMVARGRVLVTGLGLGCVVRGLLAVPEVTHVDVIECDRAILRMVKPSFADNPRVTIHHDDALTFELGEQTWDYAWHDIWTDGPDHLDVLHAQLYARLQFRVRHGQGAWNFDKKAARVWRRKGFALINR